MNYNELNQNGTVDISPLIVPTIAEIIKSASAAMKPTGIGQPQEFNRLRRLRPLLPTKKQLRNVTELGEFDIKIVISVHVQTRNRLIANVTREVIIPGALAPGFDKSQVEKIFKKESGAMINEVMASSWFKET